MFSFHLYARDETFDPLHGTLPDHLHLRLGDQLERARAVLCNRDRDQIAYAIESLDWMLRESNQVLFDEIRPIVEAKGSALVNRVKALRAYMAGIDIDKQSHLPNARWAEYFAALVLAYIQEWLFVEQEHATRESSLAKTDAFAQEMHAQMARNRPQIACEYAIEAMDAVGFAEQLAALDAVKEQQRQAGAQGARVKLQKYDALKSRCLALYEEHFSGFSNRQAAWRVVQGLTESERKTFRTEEPEITVAKWIADHKHSTR